MDTPTTAVAGRVADAMRTAERSIKGTAEAAGIPLTTFRRKIAGHTDFTVSEIARLANALDVRPRDLLPFEDAA